MIDDLHVTLAFMADILKLMGKVALEGRSGRQWGSGRRTTDARWHFK